MWKINNKTIDNELISFDHIQFNRFGLFLRTFFASAQKFKKKTKSQ